MAQYTEREWTQTKDTEQLTFIAGVNLPYRELVKESGPNTNIMVVATTADAIGYVLSPKGALAGEKVDIQMLSSGPGGGSGSVNSVSGVAPNVFITGTATDPIVNAGTQSWVWLGELTTPVLGGFQNDYTQAGFANISTLKVLGDLFNPPLFTGLQGGTEGRFLIIHNSSPDTIIYLMNLDPGSAAANQIMFPGISGDSYDLPINGTVLLRYDSDVQKWRLLGSYIYTLTDDGSGVISVSGSMANKTVFFNGVFTDGVTITGNGTSGSPLTGIAPTNVLVNNTYYVDPVYGDNATATPDSLVKKYKTIDAALAAAGTDKVIHLFPGTHSMTTSVTLSDDLRIYMEPSATLQTSTFSVAFSCNAGKKLIIDGDGTLEINQTLFAHSNPSSLTAAEIYVKCRNIIGVSSLPIVNLDGVIGEVITDEIDSTGFSGNGWCRFSVSVDNWVVTTTSKVVSLEDFVANFGDDYYAIYGRQEFFIKGRSKPRSRIKNTKQVQNAIYTKAGTAETYKTLVDIYADFDSTDGFFTNLGRGTINHYGYLVHRKTNTLGNELPWLYCDQPISASRYSPSFWHRRGSYVSGRHTDYVGSQNNELISIRCLGIFKFSGKYQNSGDNTGSGAFPIIEFRNQNASAGNTDIIMDGEFKHSEDDASLVKIIDSTNPNHTYRLMVDKASLDQPNIDTIETNVATLIYVLHSLSMNRNYNPLITDAYSVNRTMIDSLVSVNVEEYGQ